MLRVVVAFLLTIGTHARPVIAFNTTEANYTCIKIPYLFTTKLGTLIALGEARVDSCSDYASTDLVFKRSVDDGQSWSPLQVLWSHANYNTTDAVVIGNAAPVVLKSGRILVPFCKDNFWLLLSESVDDGVTWSVPRNLSSVHNPTWGWLGTGLEL
jgi:sialidase-1